MTPLCFRPLLVHRTTGVSVLYRSSTLTHDPSPCTAAFAAHGVQVAVDLRSPADRAAAPASAALFSDIEHCTIPAPWAEERLDSVTPDAKDYADWYARMLTSCAAYFVCALQEVMRQLPRVTVVCCSQGKDRTGLLTAALLEAAGAPRTLILRDHAKSAAELAENARVLRDHWHRRGMSASAYLNRYAWGAEPLRLLYQRLPDVTCPVLSALATPSNILDLQVQCRQVLADYEVLDC